MRQVGLDVPDSSLIFFFALLIPGTLLTTGAKEAAPRVRLFYAGSRAETALLPADSE